MRQMDHKENIDENSPDADEERNQSFLRNLSPPAGEEVDVVTDHRSRNRATRPPSPSRLLQASLNLEEQQTDDEDEDDIDIDSTQRARRGTKAIGQGAEDPSNLAYYNKDPLFKSMIIRAMDSYRAYLALVTPFPTMAENFDDAEQFMADEISAAVRRGELSGAPSYNIVRAMSEVVFRVGPSQRGTFKQAGRTVVKIHYQEAISPNKGQEYPGNQLAETSAVKECIQELLENYSFLHGNPNPEGVIENFSHPAIRAMITEMYYTPNKPIARLSPDFHDSVSHAAAALAMTVVYNCLEEYRTGVFSGIPFEGKTYSKKYDLFMKSLATVGAHSSRGPRLRQLQRDWAQSGLSKMKKPLADADMDEDFTNLPIHLD